MSRCSAIPRPPFRLFHRPNADVMLQNLLSRKVKPMNLRNMYAWNVRNYEWNKNCCAEMMLDYVQQLTTRIAKCYEIFNVANVKSAFESPNYSHLRELRTLTRKDLEYCILLEEVAKRRVELTALDNNSIHDKWNILYQTHSVNSALTSSSLFVPSITNESLVSNSSHNEEQEKWLFHWQLSHFPEILDKMLVHKDSALYELPFEHALQILRPHYSLLDMIVSDGCVYTPELNKWLANFCKLRVSWRLWHEHIMHISSNFTHFCADVVEANNKFTMKEEEEMLMQFPPVVSACNNIVDVIKESATSVAELYSSLFDDKSDYSLIIHVKEDKTIANVMPGGVELNDYTYEEEQINKLTVSPSERIYLVKENIMYALREVLKNACLATSKVRKNIEVEVKYVITNTDVVIDIIDHAGGISPNHAEDIWRFGWTTSVHYKASLGGLGVGLPMSRVYMEIWGSSMRVFSHIGSGTTVRLRFPKLPIEHEETCL